MSLRGVRVGSAPSITAEVWLPGDGSVPQRSSCRGAGGRCDRESIREYAAAQRARYRRAARTEKGRILDEVVVVTGECRKATLRLPRRWTRASASRPRAGRPRVHARSRTREPRGVWMPRLSTVTIASRPRAVERATARRSRAQKGAARRPSARSGWSSRVIDPRGLSRMSADNACVRSLVISVGKEIEQQAIDPLRLIHVHPVAGIRQSLDTYVRYPPATRLG